MHRHHLAKQLRQPGMNDRLSKQTTDQSLAGEHLQRAGVGALHDRHLATVINLGNDVGWRYSELVGLRLQGKQCLDSLDIAADQ